MLWYKTASLISDYISLDVDRVQLPDLQHNLCIPMVGAGRRSLFSIQLYDMCTRLRRDQTIKQSRKHNQRGKLRY